jgi:N6-L-threonylcarbamoyladenine synthase
MSFSGLKTAIRYRLRELGELTDQHKADMAASFQATVIAVLQDKVSRALKAVGHGMPLVIAGGVAANQAIKTAMSALAESLGSRCIVPPPALCTDNAAMIAWAGLERFQSGLIDSPDVEPRARWPLHEVRH